MKHFKLAAIVVLALLLTACKNNSQNTNTASAIDASISKIEVLDFHSTHRCMTCNAIEANTRHTLNTYFAEELKDQKITFQLINVDQEENKTIAEKFQAAGTALFLNVIKDGKENHIDLTEFAFMKGNNQEAFSKDLKAKIDTQLKAL